jgi:hypothetical protein
MGLGRIFIYCPTDSLRKRPLQLVNSRHGILES